MMKLGVEVVRVILTLHLIRCERRVLEQLALLPLVLAPSQHPMPPIISSAIKRCTGKGGQRGTARECTVYRMLQRRAGRLLSTAEDFANCFSRATARLLQVYTGGDGWQPINPVLNKSVKRKGTRQIVNSCGLEDASESKDDAERASLLANPFTYGAFHQPARAASVHGAGFVETLLKGALDDEIVDRLKGNFVQLARALCLVRLARDLLPQFAPLRTLQQLARFPSQPKGLNKLERFFLIDDDAAEKDCTFMLIAAILSVDVYLKRQGPAIDAYLRHCHRHAFPAETDVLRTLQPFRKHLLHYPSDVHDH